MARKKMRRFADGGQADEIVVRGAKKAPVVIDDFDLRRIGGSGGLGGGLGTGMAGDGGMGQRMAPLGPAPMPPREQMPVTPVMMSSRQSDFDRLTGAPRGRGMGMRGSMRFKEGGKADAHEPTGGKKRNKAKKYATGGKVSSASKRADGCAVKGKTKGKMV